MSLIDCWKILGADPTAIINEIRSLSGQDRIDFMLKSLELAKKLAKKLHAEYHPDKNNGKEDNTKKFMRVSTAINCLTEYTNEYIESHELLKLRLSTNKNRVLFK